MFYSFAINFICCDYGEFLVHRFDMIVEELCKCDWYLFPLSMQRILIVVITNSHQSTAIRGYGNVTCTRETLKMVHI